MQACKLADYEMRSDYENAKHVLIQLILNEGQNFFLTPISLYLSHILINRYRYSHVVRVPISKPIGFENM